MNIKGVINNLMPVDFVRKTDTKKTRNEPERDPAQGGNGGGAPPEQHRFNAQELEEALKILKDLPGVKENNLQFRVEWNGSRVVVFLEDYSGKVIRRIADVELWLMIKNRQQNSTRGNLLNKAL